MTLQSRPDSNARHAALVRLAVLSGAIAAWVVIAIAGWNWIQFADRVLDLPGLRVSLNDWATEFLNPDGVMRRAIRRTTRG